MTQLSEARVLELYRATIGPLYGAVARHCGGDRALAEDVVQETWLRAVEAWRRQGVPDVPAAWLMTVARNLLNSHFRRTRAVPIRELTWEPAATVNTRERDAGEAEVAVRGGLHAMAPEQAAMIRAFHLDERPVADIARDLGVSPRAVEGRLRRARQALGALLGARRKDGRS